MKTNLSVLRGMGTVAALAGNIAKAQQPVWEDTPLFRKTFFQATQTCCLALLLVAGAHAAPLDLQSVPLYLSAKVTPNVLIDLSVETPMGGAAYNDNTGIPTGCTGRRTVGSNPDIGTCYFPTTTYLGYFDPNKCYTYSTQSLQSRRRHHCHSHLQWAMERQLSQLGHDDCNRYVHFEHDRWPSYDRYDKPDSSATRAET